MENDIIAELRSMARNVPSGHILVDAADEIERLRKIVDLAETRRHLTEQD